MVPDYGYFLRGDATTVVQGDADPGESWLEWMTADDTAFTRLNGLIDLAPEDGEREIVFAFEGLTPEQRNLLADVNGGADDRFVKEAARGLGRLRVVTTTPNEVRFQLATTRPDELARALLAVVPRVLNDRGVLADRVVLAVRPVRVSVFEVVRPSDRTEYALPTH